MVEVIDLVKTYHKAGIEIPAVDKIGFSVERGEFVSIVGRSGSGKSTLLNLVGGLDTASGGSIIFNGQNIASWSRNELAIHRRFHVGMIFQSFNLIYTRNALDNVLISLILSGVPKRERKPKAISLLEEVGLGDRLYHKPDELSGGETQRVAIARALANNPEIILADEPTGNLDSQTAEEIIQLLIDLNKIQKKTIIMVTHDHEMAERVSNRVIRLLDGKILEDKHIRINEIN